MQRRRGTVARIQCLTRSTRSSSTRPEAKNLHEIICNDSLIVLHVNAFSSKDGTCTFSNRSSRSRSRCLCIERSRSRRSNCDNRRRAKRYTVCKIGRIRKRNPLWIRQVQGKVLTRHSRGHLERVLIEIHIPCHAAVGSGQQFHQSLDASADPGAHLGHLHFLYCVSLFCARVEIKKPNLFKREGGNLASNGPRVWKRPNKNDHLSVSWSPSGGGLCSARKLAPMLSSSAHRIVCGSRVNSLPIDAALHDVHVPRVCIRCANRIRNTCHDSNLKHIFVSPEKTVIIFNF